MIAIFDTNILISALLNSRSLPALLIDEWTERRFDLVSSEEQLDELRRVSRYPKVAAHISAQHAGRLVKQLRDNAKLVGSLPHTDLCRDPFDNFLLAMAQVSQANYLVTGDKADLLSLRRHRATQIVAVRRFAEVLGIR